MIKIYKQKINYHNLNGDFGKGTLWKLNPNTNRYFNDFGSFLAADYVEKNPDIFDDYTKQYILSEAKNKYPLGTKYKSLNTGMTFEIDKNTQLVWNELNKKSISDVNGGCLYYDGVWAEKVKHIDPSIKIGDKIYRIYPSGKKVLGIASAYVNYKYLIETDIKDFPVTHFWSLERYDDEGGVSKNSGYGLGSFMYEKAEPVMTTEDGKDVYKGGFYYFLDKSYNIHFVPIVTIKKDDDGTKRFASKEKAIEYVKLYKPKYSEDQINKAIESLFHTKLKEDNSVFGEVLKIGYRDAFFKHLNNE
ncbi:MAG: hypothetical protein ACOCUD_02890 [Bacillota bacterium]